MKRILSVLTAVAAVAGVLLAQSVVDGRRVNGRPQSYDPRAVPPLTLPEAYAMALAHIGKATNQFHYITASCIEMTNGGWTGWTFRFSDTNGRRGSVDVFFDKEVWTAPRRGEVRITD
jgi:hypothetical protein